MSPAKIERRDLVSKDEVCFDVQPGEKRVGVSGWVEVHVNCDPEDKVTTVFVKRKPVIYIERAGVEEIEIIRDFEVKLREGDELRLFQDTTVLEDPGLRKLTVKHTKGE